MPTATSLVNHLYLTQKLKDCSHKVIEFSQFLAGRLEQITCSTTYNIFLKVTLNSIKAGDKQSDADYLQNSTFQVLNSKLELPSSRDKESSLLTYVMR